MTARPRVEVFQCKAVSFQEFAVRDSESLGICGHCQSEGTPIFRSAAFLKKLKLSLKPRNIQQTKMGRLQVSGKDGKQFLLNFCRY